MHIIFQKKKQTDIAAERHSRQLPYKVVWLFKMLEPVLTHFSNPTPKSPSII